MLVTEIIYISLLWKFNSIFLVDSVKKMFMVLTSNMSILSRACKPRLLKPLRTENLETKAVSILEPWLLGSKVSHEGDRREKADERVDTDNKERIEKVDPGVVAAAEISRCGLFNFIKNGQHQWLSGSCAFRKRATTRLSSLVFDLFFISTCNNLNFFVFKCIWWPFPTLNFDKYRDTALSLTLSGHRIKRTPSIKRTVAEVPKFISLIYFKWNLY